MTVGSRDDRMKHENECSFRSGQFVNERVQMERDKTDKRTAILAAALDLIAEQGFQGSPMSQVAQRADIGVGTIYRYFDGKDDLLNALYLEVKRQITGHVVRGYSEDIPLTKAFKQALRNIVEFYAENPQMLSFSEQYLSSPLITATTHEEGMRVAEPVSRLFQRACEQELLKPMPISLMAEMIYGAVMSLAKYFINGLSQDRQADMDAGVEAIWDMIRS